MLLAVNLFVLGMLLGTLRRGREHSVEQARTTSGNLAQVLERTLEGEIRNIDLALFSVAKEITHEMSLGRARGSELGAFTRDLSGYLPFLDSLRTTNAAGEILTVAGTPPPAGSLADRSYFRKLRDEPGAGLQVARPVQGANGNWEIEFARRIDLPGGGFGGVASAVIGRDAFTRALSAVDPGPGGAVVLRDGEFGLISRYPFVPGLSDRIGDKRLSPAFQAVWEQGRTSGTYTTKAGLDEVERTLSFRQVGTHPIFISVGLASDDYLAQWRQDATKAWMFYGLFCGFTILSGGLLLRSWMRERRHRIRELASALEEVKALSGMLPICSNCKKIRDDRGYWNQIEAYIQARSEAQFTHGICPDCSRVLYPEIHARKEHPQG
jgi:hypothetical protein